MFAGNSPSLRDHPRDPILSLKDVDAMFNLLEPPSLNFQPVSLTYQVPTCDSPSLCVACEGAPQAFPQSISTATPGFSSRRLRTFRMLTSRSLSQEYRGVTVCFGIAEAWDRENGEDARSRRRSRIPKLTGCEGRRLVTCERTCREGVQWRRLCVSDQESLSIQPGV